MNNNGLVGYADEYSEEDFLGGEKYYKGLADFIMKCQTPMTISIQGDWGSGKTTALNLIEKNISERDKKYQVLWFKTWQYSKSGLKDDMALSLMMNLCSKLDQIAADKGIKMEKISLPSVFSFMGHMASEGALMFLDTAVGGRIADKAEKVRDGLAKQIYGAGNFADFSDIPKQFEEMKEKMQKYIDQIIGDSGRLIVFIDDLDRLEPKVALELLEGLKIFMDCKKCVYVLAMDSKVIFQGVKSKYGESFGDENAKNFFDKIIQVPFSLPVSQYNLKNYITQFVQQEELVDSYLNVITTLLEPNPRSIKRAFNLLQLYKLIMSDLVGKPEDEVILFSIILFQMKDEKSYTRLVDAAKESSEKILNLIKSPEYNSILEALDLQNVSDFDESKDWKNFIALLESTSRITVNVLSENAQKGGVDKNIKRKIESIRELIDKTSLTEERPENNIIDYYAEGHRKLCSFRGGEEALNIVVYKIDDAELELPEIKGLICKRSNQINSNQIRYFKSTNHITFVDVHKCNNDELIRRVLQFYKICRTDNI